MPILIGMASLLFLFGTALSALAQSTPDASLGKPTPKGGKLTATKGQPVTITLASEAKTAASVVEFLIRDFPLNGKLGNLVSDPNDRTRAKVNYTPFGDSAATVDTFTFAVRYPGGLWSNKVKVEIELKASEPIISATPEIEFGRVMLGDSAVAEIFLSNTGNAAYRNQIQLPPPFSFVDPPNGVLGLPVGGQRVVKVRFTPQVEGPVNFNLAFFRNQGSSSKLTGAGYAPFSVGAEGVLLGWEEKSRSRIGELTVTNHSPELLPVVLKTDERLRVTGQGDMFLQPNGEATLQIYLPASDSQLYAGNLTLSSGAFSIPVQVSADLAPGYLVVENTGTGDLSLDFGPLRPGEINQASFQLGNQGGSPVKVRMITEAPFTLLAAGGRATLDPQEAEPFAVRVVAPEGITGTYEGKLAIEGENGQKLHISLKAAFLGPEQNADASMGQFATAPGAADASPDRLPTDGIGAPPVGSSPAPRSPQSAEVAKAIAAIDAKRSPLGFITEPTVERKIVQWVPTVPSSGLSLVDEGRQHLTINWPEPGTGFDSYTLEMRMTRLVDSESLPESVWVPYSDVIYSAGKGGTTEAEIRGLAPDRTYEFRLFTLGDNDQVSEPVAFVAKTHPPLDWTWIYVSFLVLVVVALAAFVWWWLDRSEQIPWRFPDFRGLRQ